LNGLLGCRFLVRIKSFEKILSQITEEEVNNGDYDELGEGMEVRQSSWIVYVSGIVNEKG